MIFIGLSRTFSTKDNDQYNTIGAFWDEMSAIYGMENLRGLGYNFTLDTIEYVIGLKNNGPIKDESEGVIKRIIIPDANWISYDGETKNLDKLYERIYKNGKLTYEIECFNENGSCKISINRSTLKKHRKHMSLLTGEDIDMFNETKMDEMENKNICDTNIDGA